MILPFERDPSAPGADESFDSPRDVTITFGELPVPPQCDPEPGTKAWRNRLHRRDEIQLAADSALKRWRRLVNLVPNAPPVVRPLARAPRLGVSRVHDQHALPPPRREEVFKGGTFRTFQRVFVWLWGSLRYVGGTVLDMLLFRDSIQRRAARLRRTFEAMGTTFIKLGQQLSMRLDILPYAYTHELESMFDRVPPMDEAVAIATVEKALGKKLDEVFSAFDKKPIGSASVACVYHAILRTGEHVAVKVRRPGIGAILAADMRALSWLLTVAEFYLIPPGFTANFMHELREMLLEELDFGREARFTALFRRKMAKTKQLRFATAPRVYFEFSAQDVLVTEFVTGTWMHEILTAIETNDRVALEKLHDMNIEPVILARRMQLVARFNNFENIFFHADIHPANLLVQPGNRIVLIDFGSCGSFSKKELTSWRRWFDAQSVNDVGGMVQAALGIIEPVPPIDKDEFALRLETMFWNDLYAIKDKNSHWSERISARLWIRFLKLSREYRVPMRLNTLRMIRASMLADTIAARLDHDQDPYAEFRHYAKGAGRRAHKRTLKRLRDLTGPGKWTRMENGIEAGLKLVYQVQRTVDSLRSINVIPLIGKAATFAIILLKTVMHICIVTGLFYAYYKLQDPGHSLTLKTIKDIATKVATNNYYTWTIVLIIAIAGHQLYCRLFDRDK